jgi:CitMHS family citrate-Mg2+:H+ or citrate-Ca2+:H+ symporter
VLALMLNYPNVAAQRARVDAHAKAALMMASILFAAGVFTGIMKGTGMLTAMAKFVAASIPVELAAHLPFAVGLISMPLSLLFDPDSFYFGVLPVFAEASSALGVPPMQGPGCLVRPDDDRIPRQPADAGHVPAGRPGWHRAQQPPALHHSIPVATSVFMTFPAAVFGLFPIQPAPRTS